MGQTVAIIPARGGSKGLPGKNLKLFKGKPLIAWTILAAIEATSVDRVLVTTEDEKIAQVARSFGAEVPFLRPEYLAQDDSKVYDSIEYTLKRYAKETGLKIETVMILQPTSPLRRVKHIEEAARAYKASKEKALISVTKSDHPIQWEMLIVEDGKLKNYFEDLTPTNRQTYEPTYHPNGMIYIYDCEYYIGHKGVGMKNITSYVVDKIYAVDIDDIHDFEYAEFLYDKLGQD